MVSLFKKIGTSTAEPLHPRNFTVTAPLPDFTNNSKFAKFTLSGTTAGTIPLPDGVTGIEIETEKDDITVALGGAADASNTAAVAIASATPSSWIDGVIIPPDKRVSFTVGGATVLHVKPLTGGTITVHAF